MAPADERGARARRGMTENGREAVLRFLDDLRAAEMAGAEVLAAWIAVCGLDGLRGGLRAIGEREAAHAELLEERVRELGGMCTAAVAEAERADARDCFTSPDLAAHALAGVLNCLS